MKVHKIIAFITMIFIVFINGCYCNNAEYSSKKNKLDNSPITLTMFSMDSLGDGKFNDEVAKKITEITGVTLNIINPTVEDTDAISLMISSGEYPDLIYAKGDTGKLIEAGAIISLDDYIENTGDNIRALYGERLKRLRYSEKDPSIYTVGSFEVNPQIYNPNGSMQLQHAVLKELGYPEIKTLQDYENALKAYIKKYPEINGNKTIGLTLMANGWRWGITCGNIAGYVAGIPNDGQFKVNDETGEAIYKFELPEVKEYFKWLNHINAEGLLDPESFTQKEETYIKKLTQGNVLGITDERYSYDDATKTLLSLGMEERTYSPLSVTLNHDIKDQTMKDYGFSGGWGVSISATSKNKDRAFQFLDWLASDEAQVLLNWGIEGEHYIVENGKRKLLNEVKKQKSIDKNFKNITGVEKYIYPFPCRGKGDADKNGDTYNSNTLQSYIEGYNSAEKETLANYNLKSWVDMFPSREELGVSKHGRVWEYNLPNNLAIIQEKADDYVQKEITKAILGSEESFDLVWEDIQRYLKAIDIDKLDYGVTKLVQEKLKLWNE